MHNCFAFALTLKEKKNILKLFSIGDSLEFFHNPFYVLPTGVSLRPRFDNKPVVFNPNNNKTFASHTDGLQDIYDCKLTSLSVFGNNVEGSGVLYAGM